MKTLQRTIKARQSHGSSFETLNVVGSLRELSRHRLALLFSDFHITNYKKNIPDAKQISRQSQISMKEMLSVLDLKFNPFLSYNMSGQLLTDENM